MNTESTNFHQGPSAVPLHATLALSPPVPCLLTTPDQQVKKNVGKSHGTTMAHVLESKGKGECRADPDQPSRPPRLRRKTMKTFAALGFLSSDVEHERRALRKRHSAEFAQVEALTEQAMTELQAVSGASSQEYLLGLGYWLRCLEGCQGAVLLIERGLPSAPFPVLRTAFECLFFACALWRRPALAAKLQAGHDAERIKQARTMIAAGAASRVPPDRLAELQAIAAETHPSSTGLTAFEAAGAADLALDYETAYRGLGIAGAHASLRSLDDYFVAQPDGSFDLGFEPSSKRTAWLLGLVATCLRGGIERHREAHSRRSDASTPPGP
ncbi:DUF5677 domain-containing protein [Piscinibacter sp.]|uniref:DUF5677 domain-containing protein n=1 Tax=Piscinibacter sp. TaxID=1903157 RepID=UPI002C045042|nr:DUF5677 domain-containing protein [Albitalea sp.]HUG24295.1 DUF5677 domain-containing protein [Albitalea sp.]